MSKKKLLTYLRFIYKVGLFKSLLMLFSFLTAEAEYKVRWKNHDVYLRKGTTDFVVFRQVLVFEQYDVKSLQHANTIVDLGANVGLSTLYFKIKFPDARIIAIEPEKSNFRMLKKNLDGLTDVYCVNKAIWNAHKTLLLHNTRYGEYGFTVDEETDNSSANVEAVTIKEILAQFKFRHIDLLKIDIEGSEKELFADNYQNWLPNINCIVIELHDWFKPGCASAFFKAISTRPYTMSGRGEVINIDFEHVT